MGVGTRLFIVVGGDFVVTEFTGADATGSMVEAPIDDGVLFVVGELAVDAGAVVVSRVVAVSAD